MNDAGRQHMRGPKQRRWIYTRPSVRQDLRCQRRGESGGHVGASQFRRITHTHTHTHTQREREKERDLIVTVLHPLSLACLLPDDRPLHVCCPRHYRRKTARYYLTHRI
ncbi:hypothetical protein LX32DRAFT_193239 [Colletotrichum zoysiae]|uniref:Uncharacterized protein n=1 Tax=Colletotrichum zoysiae TaxID=1216348 RepID=A0AAD9H6U7_9PEZI|nr:hypothetical protein LX32DRAFT_193239 [Colletotrichum zoysiae]